MSVVSLKSLGFGRQKRNSVTNLLQQAGMLSLCLILALSVSPFGLLNSPARASAFSGEGTGAASDPFLITTCEELESLGTESVTDYKVFWLANDIDCTGVTFTPITNFYGTLDGRNHTISNLTIERPSYNYTALFENILGGSLITNLTLDDTNTITGGWGSASIAGEANNATLHQIHSAATVITTDNMAGGLVGQTHGWEDDMIIEQSSFTGTISSGDYAGGIVGDAYMGYTIQDVLVDADISGYALGGVIGNSEQACGYRKLDRAIVRGTLTGDSFLGGFVGAYNNNQCHLARIQDSVSLATLSGGGANGGAVGRSTNAAVTISNTYFNTTAAGTTDCTGTIVSGTVSACGSVGSNAAPSDNPYSTWDFDTLWEVVTDVVQFRAPADLAEGPSSPLNLAVTQGAPSNSVNVTWEAPASLGSFSFENYRLEIKKAEDSWDGARYSTTTGTENSFDSLRLGQTYNIRVQAVTAYGGSIWAEEVYSAPDPEVYTASNCQELQDLAHSGGSYLDTYELANDIDCSGVENFEPLDWGDGFAGIFDGNGHTISNIQITGEDMYLQGLLRSTNGATIQDLRLEDGVIDLSGDSSACGAVAGEMYETNVSAVYVRNFSVTCNSQAGGIAGYVNVGDNNPVQVEVEHVSVIDSTITSNYNRAGGLFGLVEVYDESFLKVMKSYADATVSSPNAAGGLFGRVTVEMEDDASMATQFLLQDSYSRGFVSAEYSAGGIIGDAETYNDGYDSIVELELENVYSTAEVEASEANSAGIIGYLDELYYEGEQAVLNNVFAAGSVTAGDTDYAHSIIGNQNFADDDGEYTSNNVYYDLTRTGQIQRDYYDGVDNGYGKNQSNSDPNYFINNTSNPPLNQWDFVDIWQANSNDFPTLIPLPDNEESNLPEDLNGDNILDSEQPNIGGYVNIKTGKIVAMDMGENCELTGDDMTEEGFFPTQDAAYEYANGLFEFTADCSVPSTTIKLYYYDVDPTGLVARKYSTRTNSYFTLDDAVITTQIINGHSVTVVSYQIVDNGERDMDLEVGSIEDPAGLAKNIVSVPNTGLDKSHE